MALTITSISGTGGNPPTHIIVTGTVTGCEQLHVMCSCTNTVMPVPIPTGGANNWSISLPNDKNCPCGAQVTVTAYCGIGAPGDAKATVTLTLNCDTCPQVSGAMSTPGDCDASSARPVTLTVNFNPPVPQNATASVSWIPGGTLAPSTTVLNTGAGTVATVSQTFNYPAGTYYPTAVVACTLPGGQVCTTTVVAFGTLTVPPCLGCPSLAVTAQVTGCAPTNAAIALSTQLTWPAGTVNPPAATNYFWTIDNPGNTRRAQRSGAGAVNTASGWTGALATAAGAVDLTQAGTYAVSVHAAVPGVDASCDPADATSVPVPPCQCPAPVSPGNQEWTVTNITAPFGPNTFQTLDCDRATITMTLAVNPGGYQPGDLRYSWDFGDGTAAVTGQGPTGATQTHTFTNPTAGQSHTYTVSVTISVANSTCGAFSRTASVIVPGCSTSACPQVSQLTPDKSTGCINPGGTVTFNFTAGITNPGAVAGGFQWDFGDGATQSTQAPSASHTYNRTGTFTVRVTVNGAAGSNCPPSSLTTTITVTDCTTTTSMPAGCWVLLIAALILGVVGAVLGIIAACAANPYLGIAAGIIGVVALILLILWLIFCARGHCDVFNWARWIVMWILMLAVIVGIILAIVSSPLCGLMAAFIMWGYWGVVLAILDIAGPKIGCPLLPPPWP